MTEAKSWSDLVNAALERVGWAVLQRAEQTGTPVITWENGKVVELSTRVLRERLMKREAAARRQCDRQPHVRED